MRLTWRGVFAATGGLEVIVARHAYSLAIAALFGVPMIFDAHKPPVTVLETLIMRWLIATIVCVAWW